MAKTTRRTAIAASIVAGTSLTSFGRTTTSQDRTKDEEFVMGAGMTEQEAALWRKVAEVAGDFFWLPELHSMDNQEVASAIHVIQNKLLSRPTYRKYLELAKANELKKR